MRRFRQVDNRVYDQRQMREQSEAEKRKIILATVLQGEITFSARRKSLYHGGALTIMLLALGSTIAATVLGVSGLGRTQVVGCIAALPALFAYTAIALKLEGKAGWHNRRFVKLRVFLSRLNLELSDPILIQEVRALSSEHNKFNEDMDAEWERELSFDFLGIGKRNGFTPQSSESSAAPSPGPQGPGASTP